MIKHEWKKHEKELYLPKPQPTLLTVGPQTFFTLTGQGNPNEEAFAERVQVLMTLSWSVKMMPKKNPAPEGYYEYTVYPLEGLWESAQEQPLDSGLEKDKLRYTIMVRQPEFATAEVFAKARELTRQKLASPLLDQVRRETMEDGLCVQMLHVGAYDDEPASFAKMEEFMAANDLAKRQPAHREIYLTDARKTAPEKQKTVLRYLIHKL